MTEHADKKLFLLDAYALIFRAYYAFIKNPRVNSKGLDTSAIFGFTNSLLEVLQKEKPSHIAVVFDTAKPTVRHEQFEQYKANRDATPEGIKVAVPYIKKLIEAFNIPVLFSDGYEADDVIGTLAKKAEKQGFTTYMMTPDKDFGQLVSDHIFMYKPARGGKPAEIWGVQEVCKNFEIERVEQVIDFLGMMGDAVDNIPGLPGVGEKTAKKFLAEYGSMENLLANTHELKGKMKEKVEANKDLGILSKELAKIIIDVPIEFDEKALEVEEPNPEAIKELFTELEFRTLAKRVLGEEVPVGQGAAKPAANKGQVDLFSGSINDEEEEEAPKEYKTIENYEHNYQLADTTESRKALLEKLLQQTSVCFDTETTGIDAHQAEMVGMSFSYKSGEGYYVPTPENQDEAKTIINEFKPFFENENIEKVGQNLKYDITILRWYGVEVKGKLFDTMLAHYLIQPDMKHNMDVLSEVYLSYKPVSIETLIGKKGKNQGSMRDVSVDDIKEYATEDADITWQLKEVFAPKLKEQNAEKLFWEVESPLVNVLTAMEMEGVKLDTEYLNNYSEELAKETVAVEAKIKELAGEDFNIASPKQLGEILFEKMKLVDKPKKTKTGQYSTSEDTLQYLADKHEIIQCILDFRQIQKLKSTYVDTLPSMINPKTGRVHTNYHQAVAATGRLSSNEPNLQNIPIRTERGRRVREAFIPRDENHVLLAADYSQIELRLIAHLSQDEAMLEAFSKGEDIHTATAAKVFKVGLDEVTREMRGNAKTVNFGIIYGVSAFGLSQQTNLSRKESSEIINSYFETYPRIKAYMDESIEVARKQGYVETLMGRRRYLKDINSRNAVVRKHAERNAINAPIQGSAADVIKMAMINIHNRFNKEGFDSKMILQVHDELVFDASKAELETIQPIIKHEMENAIKVSVPLDVEMGYGENWLVAH